MGFFRYAFSMCLRWAFDVDERCFGFGMVLSLVADLLFKVCVPKSKLVKAVQLLLDVVQVRAVYGDLKCGTLVV